MWLEPGIDPQITNYRLVKDDRIEFPHTVTRGVTAIYCKNEIVHNRVPLPAMQGIDATAVQIKIKNSPPINIVSAYVRIKAEVIADSLQEQFEPNHVAGREDFDQRIHAEVENFLATPHVQEIEPTTPTEVLTYVQRIKPKKSTGLDQIYNHMIKNLPLKFLLFITLLIKQLFKNNYFPDPWKTAVEQNRN
ncbi:putative RNA-directed DNA polymerase from transposon BS [Trichonephila clavipes]|nr:putative RNA-directed DNA polymerase from transposon BS [Trichonephila clavipes]